MTEGAFDAGKQVDLNGLLHDFTAWQQATTDLSCENNNLEVQLKVLNKQLQACEGNEKTLIQDVQKLQAVVDTLQGTLSKRCDIEEENSQLKKKLADYEDKLIQIKQEHETAMCEARDELQILQENNKVEIERVQEAERKQAKQKVAVVEERLQNKDQQVTEVLNQLTSLKKEKHDELMKIRLEYDAKVLSLRKQNQKTAQQKGQANAANHEIFRKKWQHMKAESEREIASLKRTIADLQRKVDMQGTSTKRRKF